MIMILAIAVMISISPVIISFHADAASADSSPTLLDEVRGDGKSVWSDANDVQAADNTPQRETADSGLDNNPYLKKFTVNRITYTTVKWTDKGWASFADPGTDGVTFAAESAAPIWSGGGTEADPYLINNAEDLANLSEAVNSGNTFAGTYFLLTADIDLGIAPYNAGWIPIGKNDIDFFGGIFDGGNNVIHNLTVKSTSIYSSLFGFVGTGGVVKYLGIDENSTVSGTSYVGGVAGANFGTVANCYSKGPVGGGFYVGGVAGHNGGTVTNCYSTGSVSCTGRIVGGVVGANYNTVTNCFNTGSVSGGGYFIGGVSGENYGTIMNCYNTGSVVSGGEYVSGVTGSNENTLTNCYSTGSVSGNIYVGGVSGRNNNGTFEMCYYNKEAYTGPDNGIGMGLTIPQMTANAVLTGAMSGLGPAFEKRANDLNLYYPELSLFKESADPAVREASRLSVIAGAVWSGDGTAAYPYLINNAEALATLSGAVNGGNAFAGTYFLMTADIDLGVAPYNTGWTPIGNSGSNSFRGIFDGGGRVIQSLTVKSTSNYAGLFGYVGTGGVVKDLGIDENSTVKGAYYVGGVVGFSYGAVTNCYSSGPVEGTDLVGGVVGYNFYGTVTNCYSTGSISSSNYYVGGVTGANDGVVKDCYSTGSISGRYYVGGTVGNNGGTITNCYSTGPVSGSYYVGGVAGGNNNGMVTNCYSTSSVNGTYNVGGVVGGNYYTVANCYSTGPVNGTDRVGGIVGENYGTIMNCYSTCPVGGKSNVGGVTGWNFFGAIKMCYYNADTYTGPDNGYGIGLTTSQMTADDVLTGAMSGLGPAFEKRGNDDDLYYSELSVFKESIDPAVQEASRISVIAGIN